MQAEIDIPNPDGILRPGMYVTVAIAIDRGRVWTVPSTAVRFQGQQAYLYLAIDGKIRQVPVQIGPSDDRFTEVLRKRVLGTAVETWAQIDGKEQVLIGTLDAKADGQPAPVSSKK